MQQPGGRTDMVMIGAPDGPDPEAEPAKPRRRWKLARMNTARMNTARVRRRVLTGAVVGWALVLTAVVFLRDGAAPAPVAAPSPRPSASAQPMSVAEVYRTLLPSVVRIESGEASGRPAGTAESATGTGVIVNADGAILTALHVVEGAGAIKIRYADGTETVATVGGSDPARDIAVLAPQKLPETLVPAVLGGGAQVGDAVVAIGNPLGLTASTTSGVISGLDRVMTRDDADDVPGLIQFDAAVNPGSSGGPLIDDQGQVTGIVIALANPTEAGTFIGIGFAVPIGAALGAGAGAGRTPPL